MHHHHIQVFGRSNCVYACVLEAGYNVHGYIVMLASVCAWQCTIYNYICIGGMDMYSWSLGNQAKLKEIADHATSVRVCEEFSNPEAKKHHFLEILQHEKELEILADVEDEKLGNSIFATRRA